MRNFNFLCYSTILLLLTLYINGRNAFGNNSNSSSLQGHSNIKEDCVELTTTSTVKSIPTVTFKKEQPVATIASKPCCHKVNSTCCDNKSDKKEDEAPEFESQVIGASVLLLIAGLYLMVYGFPLFRITVAVIGFIFGGKAFI